MKFTKLFFGLLVASAFYFISSSTAFAQIGNWCADDPVGNNACASNENRPLWIDPGYSWRVFHDVGLGNGMCVQYSVNGMVGWTRHACTFVGNNSSKEDCIDLGTCGTGRTDHWECTLPSNLINENEVIFQFYGLPLASGSCDNTVDGFAWSSQPTFQTGPLAVTMQNLDTNAPTVSPVPFILLLLLTVATGGILLTQRRNQPN